MIVHEGPKVMTRDVGNGPRNGRSQVGESWIVGRFRITKVDVGQNAIEHRFHGENYSILVSVLGLKIFAETKGLLSTIW